ncbi:SH3 domain-containing YSC84-like protein 1 [Pseudocercospora fuligena]|uniref:SH3 domain-containing YSC84-like protein 1 n=1 Tax=Pseudocercospora fuligena TaxID=685502 RepID=A0A8H6RUY0_9PEZI|nr:SH3 domain-containing YSC84-like protein 1 [Pseudocercospora fuligena]
MSQENQTVWQRVKGGSKAGFDKAYKAIDKLGAPINRLSNRVGSEAFWPTTLDKESDKAARILKSFCKDGFYKEEEVQPVDGPKQKQKVLQKIPEKVIRNAKGIAIFTTMRTGLWISGAGGSGVLIAKKPDGTWSPPSGIMLHTAGLGFLVGVDIYDCVVVINTEKALEAFTKVRCTLGGEVSVVAGPVGAGAVLETEIHKRQAPIYTYMKSRGFYAGVQIDGTIVIERMDENERFYGQKLPVQDILAGKVRHPPYEVGRLMETLKAAQGDSDVDESMIPTEAPPGDYEIEAGSTFGVPDKEDPDPYGVLALEKEGMSLKEAGTQKRASWEQFSFNPSPTSPIYNLYSRQSQDMSARSASRRNSWRSSAFSAAEPKTPSSLRNSMERRRGSLTVMTDSATQTDLSTDAPQSPSRRSVRSQHSSKGSLSNGHAATMEDVPEDEELKTAHARTDPVSVSTSNGYTTPPRTPPASSGVHKDKDSPEHDDEHDDDVQIIEQPVVQSIQTVQPVTSQVVSRARLVNVPKRLPPKLPPRNPSRNSGQVQVDSSPTKDDSSSVDRGSIDSSQPDKETVTDNTGAEKHNSIEAAAQQLEEVKLDRNDDDLSANASDKVEDVRKQERRNSESKEKMPGGFD